MYMNFYKQNLRVLSMYFQTCSSIKYVLSTLFNTCMNLKIQDKRFNYQLYNKFLCRTNMLSTCLFRVCTYIYIIDLDLLGSRNPIFFLQVCLYYTPFLFNKFIVFLSLKLGWLVLKSKYYIKHKMQVDDFKTSSR